MIATRWLSRGGAALIGAVSTLAFATGAFAHVEVEAEPDIAGSPNAIVTFSAEAESRTSGIASVRIVLPTGIAPTDVTLDRAPSGWTLTPTEDGYTVSGAALPVGTGAVHSVRLTRLPDETELTFKALVTYGNGDVDRWIEEPSAANPEPDNPAPRLRLQPGPRPNPTTAAPATTAPAPTGAAATAPPPAAGSGSGWIWWLLGALGVLAAAAAATVAARRRRTTAP